jgi:glycosyltransferase involved in cell wall biosynthesis
MPRVSVIIPAYNAARYLPEAIESALAQSYQDFEILIFDNASTDETPDVVAGYRDPRIRYTRNEANFGFSGSVARAFAQARGEFAAVLGADDIWYPDFLAASSAALDKQPSASFVHTDAIWINEESRPFGESAAAWPALSSGPDAFVNCFRDGFCFSTLLIRLDSLRRAGGYEAGWDIQGDLVLFLRLCLHGDVLFIPKPLAWYRYHSSNLTTAMMSGYGGGPYRIELDALNVALAWPAASVLPMPGAANMARHFIAERTVRMLHLTRLQGWRLRWLDGFREMVMLSPRLLLQGETWARFGFGLLPRPCIAAVQRWRHNRAHQRYAGLAPPRIAQARPAAS